LGGLAVLFTDAGYWFMQATPKLGQTPEEAFKLLLDNVESLKNGDFDADDLKASLVNFEVKQKMAHESNVSRASIIVDSYIKREPWGKTVTYLDRLNSITKNDVVRVARQYLGPNRVVVFRRNGKSEIPNIKKPGFSAMNIDPTRESKKYQELISLPALPQEPHWLVSGKDYQVTPVEGGRLYATKNPYNDLFQLQIHFARGYRHEKKLCEALNLLTLSGAGPYSPEDFKRKLYALGSSLFYSCGEQTSQVILTGIDRNFWPSLELMRQRFDWPVISSGTLEKMVAVKIGAREDEKKDHQSIRYALGQWASRGQESPVLARLSNDEIRKLSESSLITVIRDFPHWQRRVGYIGPRSASEVAKLLDADGRYKPTPARIPAKLLKPTKNQIFFVDRQMNQTQVGFTAGDEVYVSTHHVDYNFYYQYMGGGMNSAIFQEVREARSLAYEANGGLYIPSFKGEQIQLFGLLGCQSDKTPEATELMMRLLNDFPSSSKRFDVAKKSVLESYITRAVEFRSIPSILMNWEDMGITDGDPRPKQLQQSLSYTLTDLENFARRFKDKPLSVYLVGPRERSGIEQLKKLGDWQEKKIDDLFPY
jgi:predicted Zn-dependent peptidase